MEKGTKFSICLKQQRINVTEKKRKHLTEKSTLKKLFKNASVIAKSETVRINHVSQFSWEKQNNFNANGISKKACKKD